MRPNPPLNMDAPLHMPRVQVSPMVGSESDFEFAYMVKRDAFGPYVVPKWGWDERYQRGVVAERLRAKRFFRILFDGRAVGTVAVDDEPDHVQVGEFYIVPSAQNQGIGSEILRPILADATSRNLPVRLECLKWNLALAFYRRHGFEPIRESETHVFLERRPDGELTSR